MEFPNLRGLMRHRRVRIYELSKILKMSDASFSHRLVGKYEFAPHERTRIAEFFCVDQKWLFAPLAVPPPVRRETAMLSPGMESRVG